LLRVPDVVLPELAEVLAVNHPVRRIVAQVGVDLLNMTM
jgi:hypothetical protein